MSYQEPKSWQYGVNLCESCLEKQREIECLKEEIGRLRQKLNLNERKLKEGFFDSSTSSVKVPIKESSLAEKQAKQGGGQPGHQEVGRKIFTSVEADERRIAKVETEFCQTCQCALHQQSANERGVYELERERVKKVHYQIERKKCPLCQKIINANQRLKNTFVENK